MLFATAWVCRTGRQLSVVENPAHVNDLHAAMFYLFGIEHTRLIYRSQGRDFRLTDVGGQVVQAILA